MIQLMGDDGLYVFDGTVLELFGFHGKNHRWHAALITKCHIEARKKGIALKIEIGTGAHIILLPEEQMEPAKQLVDAVLAARDQLRGGS